MKEKETPQAQGTSVSPQDVTGTKFSQFKKIESSENLEVVGVEGPVNVRMPLRTSNIATDPEATLFDDEETPELKTQLEVNRYLASKIDGIEFPPGTVVSDTAPEDPEEGMTWYDTERLELFVFAEDAWLPCSPLGARVEAGEVLQAEIVKQIQQSIGDQEVLEEKIEAGEKEQEELRDKVAALEGSVGHHRLTFALRLGVRPGEFTLLDSQGAVVNTLSGASSIVLSDEDTDGSPIQIGRIEPNDIIRLVSVVDSNEGAELRVTDDENDVFQFVQISGTADRLAEDLPYAFTLLSSFDPEGLATIEYVDSRVDTKLEVTGDKMSGVLDMQDNYIANVKDPGSDGDAVNRRTLNEKMEGVLRQDSSGHTIVDQEWRLRSKASDDGTWTFLRIENDAIGVYHVEDPREWHHGVNRRYVDNSIADGNFASKDEANTFKETQTFQKSTYFQNATIHNSKNSDTIAEVRGDHEDGTKQLWWKIRGTNRVSWICYPGQENRDYKKCMEMEWDADAGAPLVKLDFLQPPTSSRHAATKKYVDEEVAKAGGGSFAETGSSTPSLSAGQLFYNTTDKVLYIGE